MLNILWAHQTTSRRSTSETLYYLTYGIEAIISVEISLCSARVSDFSPAKNAEMMLKQLDSLEKHREAAIACLADYQQKLAWRYNKDVKIRDFVAGDLVLQKAGGSARDVNARKLALNWEGQYRVIAIAGAGAYYLKDMEERPLPQPWNVQNLRTFYH